MKAILVIKDIKNCDDYYAEVNIKNKKNHKKTKTFAHIDLKPMPQKRELEESGNSLIDDCKEYYTDGWNDCVDEILGGEE